MDKLGKYTIVEKIGVGGFGEVYKGYDPFIKRYIAVKTCSTDDQEVRTRFFQEAEIAGNLHHRNITTVHDFGIQDELPYLIQEYLSGEDLDRKVKRRDFLPFPEKLYYLLQIARGLGYAHSKGIIHRDIKPANIRVLEDGTTKIMDFGIARLAQQESNLTQTGMTLGTAAYLAPEQIRGENIDLRTDIFSFGVMAYELMAYERPFPGKQISTVLFSILNDIPKSLREHWPAIPDDMLQLTERCLEKDPQKRFADGNELSRELEKIQKSGRPGGAQVDDGPTVLLSQSALRPDADGAAPTTFQTTPVQAPPSQAPPSPAPSPATASSSQASPPTGGVDADSAPRRPSTDTHALDQLELTSNPADSEREASAGMRTVISTPMPTQSGGQSFKVAFVVALALVAGVAGWWFGTRSPADDTSTGPATEVEEPTVDVPPSVGDPSEESSVPSNPPASNGGAATELETVAATEPEAEKAPPPPPARGTLELQRISWSDNAFAEVGGRRYPLLKSWDISLEAGTYQVKCRLDMDSYSAEDTVRVRLRSGETRQVSCPIEQPGALSTWALPGRPQGNVTLNGEGLGATPVRLHYLPPGSYTLVISSPTDSSAEITQTVMIEPGNESVVSFDFGAGRVNQSSKALPQDGASR